MSTDNSNFLVAEAQLALAQERKEKAERIKTLGDPIQLPGIALAIQVRGGDAWISENTTIVRKLDLESGKTKQIYKGHTGPVTCLAFCDKIPGSGDSKILITGSWDQTIKLWDTETKELLSSTEGHDDFVKSLFVFPSLQLLVSGGSDKIVRFWDLSTPLQPEPLSSVGSISSHTRPVECLEGRTTPDGGAVLYTADTMGIIRSWDLVKERGSSPRWLSTLKNEYTQHRTRINEIMCGNNHIWTASADETVQVIPETSTTVGTKPLPPIAHPIAVRTILPLSLTDLGEPYLLTGSGDVIRVYDVSSLEEPELISEIDAHWHDVTAIRFWARKFTGEDKLTRVEPWIISASLDGTIRKWRLTELLNPPPPAPLVNIVASDKLPAIKEDEQFAMTEEEERELAELLDD
ncbi:WD40-repeat-containing domain protein [Crucibulum laeve]|uniref:WD40-repeat-containing domain protein n=1 Tax=Crucibulum laeve TaxID=68775 RepID=A0A5C3MCX0_9AGAR|nr:WD40-repeat-containing domain protein [Crucibulum laeve]